MTALVPVTRPNGKTYRPRKQPVAFALDDDHRGETEILVMRTHDVDRARPLAIQEARRSGIEWPDDDCVWTLSWARETIREHQPWWEYDPERGMPCVIFQPQRLPNPVGL